METSDQVFESSLVTEDGNRELNNLHLTHRGQGLILEEEGGADLIFTAPELSEPTPRSSRRQNQESAAAQDSARPTGMFGALK